MCHKIYVYMYIYICMYAIYVTYAAAQPRDIVPMVLACQAVTRLSAAQQQPLFFFFDTFTFFLDDFVVVAKVVATVVPTGTGAPPNISLISSCVRLPPAASKANFSGEMLKRVGGASMYITGIPPSCI